MYSHFSTPMWKVSGGRGRGLRTGPGSAAPPGRRRSPGGEGRTALFLTVENGAVLSRDLRRVEELARAGVVMVTLTWNGENAIGSGSQTDHGLTAFGREAAGELIRQEIVLDVSHLNDRGFWDLMEETDVPVAASHSNARARAPTGGTSPTVRHGRSPGGADWWG